MEFEDDFQSFSPLNESSPQFQPRRLKRLKKRKDDDDDAAAVQFPQSSHRLSPKSIVDDDSFPFPRVDFAELQALEAALDDSNSDDSNPPPLQHSPIRESGSVEEKMENAKENSIEVDDEFSISVEDRRDAKRVLDFDDIADLEKAETDRRDAKRVLDFDDVADLEKPETDPIIEEEKSISIEKKGKKRIKTESTKSVKGGNRKLEKERKDYLKQLHAESQRLLRESTDAAFKPTPVVGKSICDVLEKIRQRKMQVTKKTTMPYNASSVSNNVNCVRDAPEVEVEEEIEREAVVKSVDQVLDIAPKQPEISQVDQKSADLFDVDQSAKSAKLSSCENIPIEKDSDEKPTPLLRPPIDDTQDLFGDSETRDDEVDPLGGLGQDDSPLEEPFVPSLSALNLKFDSVLSDDSSSEEEDDKENVEPRRGDPVRAFVDEEAEEEDDSDHDMLRFPENEDEDMEDFEEINDIIATNYEEKATDNIRRNELHQKWLEQQDAAGTDNLLQKLKVGLNQQENSLIDEEEEEENEDIEEYNPEEENDIPRKTSARANLKKAKQMISQMFVEKDEVYVSDEDEEIEKLVKHRLLVKTEAQRVSISSVKDKNSKDVFDQIKKLNIALDSRKKGKASSYFDSVMKGGNVNGFVKSSFVGRLSSHSLPPCHKKSSRGSVRSFIFGRDDSNSRNSVITSDDSEDAVSKGNHTNESSRVPPIRTHQAKFSSQSKKVTSEEAVASAAAASTSHISLFEALRRSSSMKTGFINREDRIDITQVISTFKIPK